MSLTLLKTPPKAICNGGPIKLTKSWGKSLLNRMGFVKRRASTSAKVSLSNFNDLKAQFLFDIMINVRMDEIPHQLIIYWDQTAISYVPSGLDHGQWRNLVHSEKKFLLMMTKDRSQQSLLGCLLVIFFLHSSFIKGQQIVVFQMCPFHANGMSPVHPIIDPMNSQ